MKTIDLAEVLTQEHREIDAGIEAFVRSLAAGSVEPDPLVGAMAALRRHIYLEETLLFPPIRHAGMSMPLLVMAKEHGLLWRLMDHLDSLLAAQDVDALQVRCEELQLILDQHNRKEEPIVYPRSAGDLTSEEAQVLAQFVESGSTPDGWVCEAVG
ncbi:hemerythrin domain-containing protein [Aeromicrobium terrae]|uniref:Hemerythrin domain-containing protein n=1 Tax=Aeromicrobium terrae TaxID=2498846 RepID=A0A5C8NHJ5_9ACTN|nr:hemerythrin domain-containing protein [Aeromicrobium terrae]TXL61344.1 hemerythrin domain-containing protein [Aeromicrobium terrae]